MRTAATLLALTALLSACAPYRLRGSVVLGESPLIRVVNADDPRLQRSPLSDATVEFVLDPASIRPRDLGSVSTDDLGRFELEVAASGAGLLEYEVRVVARATGARSAWDVLALPGADKRVLIVLSPGRDAPGSVPPSRTLDRETLDMGERLLER